MNTTLSLVQAAIILGISFQEARRLIRQRKLTAVARINKVQYVEAAELQAFITRTKGQQS